MRIQKEQEVTKSEKGEENFSNSAGAGHAGERIAVCAGG